MMKSQQWWLWGFSNCWVLFKEVVVIIIIIFRVGGRMEESIQIRKPDQPLYLNQTKGRRGRGILLSWHGGAGSEYNQRVTEVTCEVFRKCFIAPAFVRCQKKCSENGNIKMQRCDYYCKRSNLWRTNCI
ncbi:hypothetical protein C5167_027408 [Papaver somniferum]|nr:hypothetical protein C5167_027408 [Papaver somniferum]